MADFNSAFTGEQIDAGIGKADTAVQPADIATVATTGAYADLSGLPTLGTAAATDATDYATAAQGALADTAVQAGDLSLVATTGAYADLSGLPTLFDGAYSSLSGIPSTFTPAAHTHVIADVTGLQDALDDKVTGAGITVIEAITQAEYDLLSPPVATTLYVITDAV